MMRAGTTNGLDIYVVCHDASDFPGKYTCRCQTIYHGGGNIGGSEISLEVLVADRIEPIRAEMRRRGLYRLPRFANDDPVIVECWL
ncbi:hypothetical protein GOA86_17605 [Sinorhizobium meliloti]|nr:hypothetical protein [Sinorhizobium meliloti]